MFASSFTHTISKDCIFVGETGFFGIASKETINNHIIQLIYLMDDIKSIQWNPILYLEQKLLSKCV